MRHWLNHSWFLCGPRIFIITLTMWVNHTHKIERNLFWLRRSPRCVVSAVSIMRVLSSSKVPGGHWRNEVQTQHNGSTNEKGISYGRSSKFLRHPCSKNALLKIQSRSLLHHSNPRCLPWLKNLMAKKMDKKKKNTMIVNPILNRAIGSMKLPKIINPKSKKLMTSMVFLQQTP